MWYKTVAQSGSTSPQFVEWLWMSETINSHYHADLGVDSEEVSCWEEHVSWKISQSALLLYPSVCRRLGVKLGIPLGLSFPTSAFRSATCNLGSTTLKYRSGTFLLGSTNVKHGILTVRWIQCQCSTDDEYIKWTAGRDHLAVACAPWHFFMFDTYVIWYFKE